MVSEVLQASVRYGAIIQNAHLLDSWIPQSVAARVDTALDMGHRTLVACRPPVEDEEVNPVSQLRRREYEVLFLTTLPMTYEEVSRRLGTSVSTVRAQLHTAYETLGAQAIGKGHAGSFIPMDEKRLRSLPLFTKTADGELEPTLSKREQRVLDLMGEQQTAKQIGLTLGINSSTVRTHKLNIGRKLGINTGQGYTEVELSRIAGALKNLARYAGIASDTANIVQTSATDIIKRLEDLQKRKGINLDHTKIARVTSPELLEKLRDGGFVPKGRGSSYVVDLPGYIAMSLMQNPDTEHLLEDEITRPIARTVIAGETAHYLRQQQVK